MKKVTKLLKSTDHIGPEIGYNFGRKPRFQTPAGGLLTIGVYSMIAFVAYTLLRKVFDTKELDV